jgi:hypothetical protein
VSSVDTTHYQGMPVVLVSLIKDDGGCVTVMLPVYTQDECYKVDPNTPCCPEDNLTDSSESP